MMGARLMLYVSLVIAILLAIMPLPQWCEPFRPDWVLMILIYWAMTVPDRVNVGTAWLVGIIVDLTLGSTLGGHALALSIAIYLVALHFRKLRSFSLLQQTILVALLGLLTRLLVFWVAYLVESAHFNVQLLWGIVADLVLWPWLYLVMGRWREQFGVR